MQNSVGKQELGSQGKKTNVATMRGVEHRGNGARLCTLKLPSLLRKPCWTNRVITLVQILTHSVLPLVLTTTTGVF